MNRAHGAGHDETRDARVPEPEFFFQRGFEKDETLTAHPLLVLAALQGHVQLAMSYVPSASFVVPVVNATRARTRRRQSLSQPVPGRRDVCDS